MSATKEPKPDDSTALSVQAVREKPVLVFSNPDALDMVFAETERKVLDFQHDLSTPTGRKKTASLAFEVARQKTALDEAGKELNSELRARINLVDEQRRSLRDRFDDLRDKARQPLTDWESAEERRKENCARDLADLRDAGMVFSDDTVADLEARLARITAMPIDPAVFMEFTTEAEGRRVQAVAALAAGVERIRLQEQHEAELEQLRAEKAARDLRDAERQRADDERARVEREKREAEERAAAERKRIELEAERLAEEEREAAERIKQAEAAERKRIAVAEELARVEAEAEAERAARERERKIEERHAAELRRIEEQAAQKERDRLAALECERITREAEMQRRDEEARAAREAEEKRQADKKHRAKIMAEVMKSIVAAVPAIEPAPGLLGHHADGGDLVALLVQAIAAGRIAHTTIQF